MYRMTLPCLFLPGFLWLLENKRLKRIPFSNITSLQDSKPEFIQGNVLLIGNCHVHFWKMLSCLVVVLLFWFLPVSTEMLKYPFHVYGEDGISQEWFLLTFRKHPHSLLLAASDASCCFSLCFPTEQCLWHFNQVSLLKVWAPFYVRWRLEHNLHQHLTEPSDYT